jgi:hypothetical protein
MWLARMESKPNPCPHTCEGLLRLLATYQKLLTVLFGTQCKHFQEVRTMRHMLVLNMPRFKKLPVESIAQILWRSVHLDARMSFSTPYLQDGTLPESQVRFANGWLSTGGVKLIEGCPVDRLRGLPSAPAAVLPGPPAGAMADWMTAAPPEHHNNHVHPLLLMAAVLPARNKRATVKMTDLINATTPWCPTVTSGLGQPAVFST